MKAEKARITIDWKKVDHLLMCGCKGSEIAANLGVHHDTLYDRTVLEKEMSFSDYSAKLRSKGDTLIRAVQFDKAVNNKDNTMLIWLGKERLGQKENYDKIETTYPNDALIEKENTIMDLKAQLNKLQELIGKLDNKPQAGQVLS